jgi:hypothetical protein
MQPLFFIRTAPTGAWARASIAACSGVAVVHAQGLHASPYTARSTCRRRGPRRRRTHGGWAFPALKIPGFSGEALYFAIDLLLTLGLVGLFASLAPFRTWLGALGFAPVRLRGLSSSAPATNWAALTPINAAPPFSRFRWRRPGWLWCVAAALAVMSASPGWRLSSSAWPARCYAGHRAFLPPASSSAWALAWPDRPPWGPAPTGW